MFSSSSFIVSGFTFESFIHFELIFTCGIRVQFHSSACENSVFPSPFIEETVLSSLCVLGTFVKNQLTLNA